MELYVGNLPLEITDADLKKLFGSIGEVTHATIMLDKKYGLSQGFGFIGMMERDGQRAIRRFNGYKIQSRSLVVKEEKERGKPVPSAAKAFIADGRLLLSAFIDSNARVGVAANEKE